MRKNSLIFSCWCFAPSMLNDIVASWAQFGVATSCVVFVIWLMASLIKTLYFQNSATVFLICPNKHRDKCVKLLKIIIYKIKKRQKPYVYKFHEWFTKISWEVGSLYTYKPYLYKLVLVTFRSLLPYTTNVRCKICCNSVYN